jgi:hypothetical protein
VRHYIFDEEYFKPQPRQTLGCAYNSKYAIVSHVVQHDVRPHVIHAVNVDVLPELDCRHRHGGYRYG